MAKQATGLETFRGKHRVARFVKYIREIFFLAESTIFFLADPQYYIIGGRKKIFFFFGNKTFVATRVCRDKTFVATKMIFVAAPANDSITGIAEYQPSRNERSISTMVFKMFYYYYYLQNSILLVLRRHICLQRNAAVPAMHLGLLPSSTERETGYGVTGL